MTAAPSPSPDARRTRRLCLAAAGTFLVYAGLVWLLPVSTPVRAVACGLNLLIAAAALLQARADQPDAGADHVDQA